MLLTGGGVFAHREYLKKYTDEIPSSARAWVDKHTNGEDILFQYVVPPEHHPPLLVTKHDALHLKKKVADTARHFTNGKGISTQKGHLPVRAAALDYFSSILGFPFVDTNRTAHRRDIVGTL